MNKQYLQEKIIDKMLENLYFSSKPGTIIASPSTDPPYQYHWIRDAALSMRVFINLYSKTKKNVYLIHIFNYIERECEIQKMNTITGIGEPKVNIDNTPYNEPWGRPQNDGPALRCLNLINIYQLLLDDYPVIMKQIVLPMIQTDINYILNNYNKTCFDLWEEIDGWHFYTRMVQLKCIKEYMIFENNEKNNNIYLKLLDNLKHHISENGIISSFDKKGNIVKFDDASILLAYCHISFDSDIIKEIPIEFAIKNSINLINYFQNKYKTNTYYMIGRYFNDKYFNGHVWILCSLGLVQFLKNINMNDKKVDMILNKILSIDSNLNLSEQYDIDTQQKISAEKLTWNYSELYFSI